MSPLALDPLYDAEELRSAGFEPWDGEPVDAAIIQADHPEFAELAPGALPGVRVIVDGRGILDPAPWRADGVTVRRIGRP
jgi:UDP-N-acetyl-D-glucosamine dehydrogenase